VHHQGARSPRSRSQPSPSPPRAPTGGLSAARDDSI
jgi:hypothetical protein